MGEAKRRGTRKERMQQAKDGRRFDPIRLLVNFIDSSFGSITRWVIGKGWAR